MQRRRALANGGSLALAERLIARDTEALGELYDQVGAIVYTLVLRVVRDPGTAEDLTQDIFMRVWNLIPAFDGKRCSLRSWVLMIARCAAIDFWRSRQASVLRRTISIEDRNCPRLSSDARAHFCAEVSQIHAALSQLKPMHRDLLELAYFAGLSQPQMAHRLEIPLGTVKTRVRSALRQLRSHFSMTASISPL
ncbi:MAG: sigma-70 family RNA polymerase sigma factor [Bryobacteraceae bacterium]|nr:sigma-70 family RNA polymerase sigma factor [Bryobacteraceae bacterium]